MALVAVLRALASEEYKTKQLVTDGVNAFAGLLRIPSTWTSTLVGMSWTLLALVRPVGKCSALPPALIWGLLCLRGSLEKIRQALLRAAEVPMASLVAQHLRVALHLWLRRTCCLLRTSPATRTSVKISTTLWQVQ